MPDISNRFLPAHADFTAFALCAHLAPPSPIPTSAPSTATVRPSYPFRCLHCDHSYRTSSQALVLDTYNGLIDDQAGRLGIARERKGTNREGRYDDEMVAEGLRRIDGWEKKRSQEVERIWAGFVERWHGGVSFDRKGAVLVQRELTFRLIAERNGGIVVFGLPHRALTE